MQNQTIDIAKLSLDDTGEKYMTACGNYGEYTEFGLFPI